MKRVFCIGNGESRAPVDLIKLRPHGKIYGCNALYRDFKPDVLTAVDSPIMHEIYQSGYADENETWFRDWNPIPGMTYHLTVFGNLNAHEVEYAKKNLDTIYENKRGDRQEFVFHGSSISGIVNIIKKAYEGEQKIESKNINHTGVYVSWINPDDKANNLKDIDGRDRGWACGASAGWVALNQNKDLEELYMIGHDLKSNTDTVNNMYKDTQCYANSKNKPIPDVNWINQWKELMAEFPKVKFIKVNPRGIKGDPINSVVPDWTAKNIDYIDFDQLNNKFDCVSGLTKKQ